MKIELNEYFKTLIADECKLLNDSEGVYKKVLLPLKMEDSVIFERFKEIDQNDFEIKEKVQIPDSGIYSKLAIRRACRQFNLEFKLNAILAGNETFSNDWNDSTEINLNDPVLIEALKQGTFTAEQIEAIKEKLK